MPVMDLGPGEAADAVAEICLDVSRRWREVMAPSLEGTRRWLTEMAAHGLWLAVAAGPRGGKRGLIECAPIRFAPDPVAGRGSLFINCLWVVPSAWGKGEARALVEHAVGRAKREGGLTVLAYEGDKWWGYFPYMPADFFRRFGFREVDRDGSRVLLHLDLGGGEEPRLFEVRERPAPLEGGRTDGRAVVEVLCNRHCPWSGLMVDGIRRGVGNRGEVRVVETEGRAVAEEYGLTRGVCVNGRPVLRRLGRWEEVAPTWPGRTSARRDGPGPDRQER